MRANLQNSLPAAALARPASMTASALAAEREPGAPRAPEQDFAHLLQDSQRRSAIDAPAPQSTPLPQTSPVPPAPAAKSATPPARDTAGPARQDAPDATGASDSACRSDDVDAASIETAATTATEASQPKDKSRPRTATRTPGRTTEKMATTATPTGDAADSSEPKASRLAAAAPDAALPTSPTAAAPSTLDAVLAQWQAARKTTAGASDKPEADTGNAAGTPAGKTHPGGHGDAGIDALAGKPGLERGAGTDLGVAASTAAMARTDDAAALSARPAFDKLLSRSLEAIVAPGAAVASGAAAYSPSIETSPATTANVPAPVDSPEFAPALAMQVSLLASDGVQKAELHLNPAEMGPVSVQISLDGTQAHVSFGADLAATRQAIEAGLPDLAGALREAGFTLAGGGVSEHASGQRQPGGEPGQPPSGGRDERSFGDAQPLVATVRHATRAGGIDLYA